MALKFLIVTILMSVTFPVLPAASASPFSDAFQAAQELEMSGKFSEARARYEAAGQAAGSEREQAAAWIGIGGTHALEKNLPAALAAYESALRFEDVTAEEKGRALLGIADVHNAENKFVPMRETLENVLALDNLPGGIRIKAHLALGRLCTNYGDWAGVKRENETALALPGITLEDKTAAQQNLAKALINLQEYSAARALMSELAANETLPADARRNAHFLIGKMLLLEKNYAEARNEFTKTLDMPDIPDALKAEIQLHIGLSYYDARDYQNAGPELKKVLDMPGASTRPPWDGARMGYVPSREARLRLHLGKLLPADGPLLKVLFIGSSHTLRGDLPDLVMQMAASSPAGRPRIIAGDYLRMGTTISTFWNAGEGTDTARGLIAAEDWDAVVFETFYSLKNEDLVKYGTQFAELIKSRNARAIVCETPIAQAKSYPEEYLKFHQNSQKLAEMLGAPVAPSVLAWMKFLGPEPTPDKIGEVYDDWIHATPKGAYLTACCIYAALTGFSPAGLAHPNLPEAEARILQQIAWDAYIESNPSATR